MSVLVVAEKPSVARDIAGVLGARSRADGYFHGGQWVVTWAIGHLVGLAEPHEMNPAWKRWRLDDLPILPASWPLVPGTKTRDQYDVVRRFLVDPAVRGVVCATDAGREGELIFRYIYEAARSQKPVKRLWISSLTPEAISGGFRALAPGAEFDRLADAARARSRADWLVGMNLSRVYSLLHDDNLSVGRVQTPTLAMLVAREIEIRDFVPEDYLEVVAEFGDDRYSGTFIGDNPNDKKEARRLPADGEVANAVVARAKTGKAEVESVERKSRRLAPPQLYDLTELQRHANRLYGLTAQRTLQIAQKLYEERKLITYPRTSSRHLSQTIADQLGNVVRAIEEPYRALLAEGTGVRPLGKRFVDDAEVTDHHAIIPTDKRAADLTPEERKIYDLICRRLLSAWHGDHVFAVTTVITTIANGAQRDRYLSSGTSVEEQGWKVLDIGFGRPQKDAPPNLPGGLAKGQPKRVLDAKAVKKQTRPPPRFNDATLLTMMETAGRLVDERELSRAMRDCGLGTPATRAAIIETLLAREYVERQDKAFAATEKGIALIERVHPHVKSPAMTGEWEAKLARIERGEETLDGFMTAIAAWVRDVIGNVEPPPTGWSAPRTRDRPDAPEPATTRAPDRPRPARSTDLRVLLQDGFGHAAFRPYQEAVCRAAADGQDVLLVMPTGAGKSLCYQLPGLARGGTTLVVSPLIALMEDQVAQLQKRGFAAERIHSGRTRLQSREVCKAYLDGALDFLFIAPERLRVPGFPELLARRRPSLIAVDEAHCISQWGHDFRPDYRLLGERLPLLRPAPVIALTATATPSVQDDIHDQLRLQSSARFVHGFRRTNIGVEAVERNPSERVQIVKDLLAAPERRPAIVYAPTRAESEKLAKSMKKVRAAAYHAGLSSDVRDRVQSAFLAGELDVIVATTAFGMGIDKPNVRTVVHTALPSSVEGYYQEIGRAGRDGAPSRAVLLHSFVDTKTHEFFLEKDYPEPDVLARVQKARAANPDHDISKLAKKTKLKSDVVEKALEKLAGLGVLNGGGSTDWRPAYEAQRRHKQQSVDRMRRFANSASCRMLQLIGHFGDDQDAGAACGICDVCAPSDAAALSFRAASTLETDAATKVLAALHARDGRAIGQIHREVFGADAKGAGGAIDRGTLDHVLGALARAGNVAIVADEFEKDGKTIAFQRVWRRGEGASDKALQIVATPPRSAKKKSDRGFFFAKRRRKKTRR